MASKEIQAEQPGQLSLVANQLVNVLDSKRDDWWLVQTMPEDGMDGIEGWVPGNKLQPAPCESHDSHMIALSVNFYDTNLVVICYNYSIIY